MYPDLSPSKQLSFEEVFRPRAADDQFRIGPVQDQFMIRDDHLESPK
jgi:hypothetical protein